MKDEKVNYIKSATGPKLIAAGEVILDKHGFGRISIPYFGNWSISVNENGKEIFSAESSTAVTATENSLNPGDIGLEIYTLYDNETKKVYCEVSFQGPKNAKIFYIACNYGASITGIRDILVQPQEKLPLDD